MKKIILISLAFFQACLPVFAAPPTRSFSYTPNTTIQSSQVTTNENNLYSYVQAGVDTYADNTIVNADVNSAAAITYSKLNLANSIVNADVSSSAAIVYSKLSLTGSILDADISTSANIDDDKLATIVATNKVGGTSLNALASIPSGAGKVPTANLGTSSATSSTFLRGDQAWADPGIGMKLISVTSITNNTTSSAITIASGKQYFIKIIAYKNATNSAYDFGFRINGDTTGSYRSVAVGTGTTGAFSNTSATSTYARMGSSQVNVNATDYFTAALYLELNPFTNTVVKWQGTSSFNNVTSSQETIATFGGRWDGAAATSFTFLGVAASDNFDAKIYLYEVSSS